MKIAHLAQVDATLFFIGKHQLCVLTLGVVLVLAGTIIAISRSSSVRRLDSAIINNVDILCRLAR
jgi:hypothetical protein